METKHLKTPQELNEASENLNLSDVSKQRELLIAFAKHLYKYRAVNDLLLIIKEVDDFLSN